jgi:tetratricopeptide (TPR) repeat protein/predicted Ser/Thr protein kinase
MIGQQILHYQILEKLGFGGMGTVYKALDTRLNRLTALKFLKNGIDLQPKEKEQLWKEAQAAAAINHPNITTIYGVEEDQGNIFIVMELIEGQLLSDLIRQKPMSRSQVLDIFQQLVSGLQAAHEQGIIHRDIKSSNIKINAAGIVKIMDFGIARITGAKDETQTAGNFSAGTPAYMSPEQINAVSVDERSDIWSLGVVLYEMMCGHLPFWSDQIQLVFYQILNKEPTPFSEHQKEIPAGWQQLIGQCLQKNPDRRYQSCQEIKDALQVLKNPATPSDHLVAEPARETVKSTHPSVVFRMRWLLMAAVLLIVIFVGIKAGLLERFAGQMHREMGLAVLPFTVIGGDQAGEALSHGCLELLANKLTQIDRYQEKLWLIPAAEIRRYHDISISEVARMYQVNFVLTGSLNFLDNRLQLAVNLCDAKTSRQVRSADITETPGRIPELYQQALTEVMRMLDDQLHTSKKPAVIRQELADPAAYQSYLQGIGFFELRYDNRENTDLAIHSFSKAIALDSNFAKAYAKLAEAYAFRFDQSKNRENISQAQSMAQKAIALNPAMADGHYVLGKILNQTGQYPQALQSLQRALDIDPAHYYACLSLADAYRQMQNPDLAEQFYQKAIALKPQLWRAYSYLGFLYYQQGKYPKAIPMFQKMIKLTPSYDFQGYNNLGAMYYAMNDWKQAIIMFEKSMAIKTNADAASNLGTLYFYQKKYSLALSNYLKAITFNEYDYQMWRNLGDCYRYIPSNQLLAANAYNKALNLLQAEIQTNPENAEFFAELAYVQAYSQDSDLAAFHIAKAMELDGQSNLVLIRALFVFEKIRQRNKAVDILEKLINLGESYAELQLHPDLTDFFKDPRLVNREKK